MRGYPNAVPFRGLLAVAQNHQYPLALIDVLHAKHLFKGDAGREVIYYEGEGDGFLHDGITKLGIFRAGVTALA